MPSLLRQGILFGDLELSVTTSLVLKLAVEPPDRPLFRVLCLGVHSQTEMVFARGWGTLVTERKVRLLCWTGDQRLLHSDSSPSSAVTKLLFNNCEDPKCTPLSPNPRFLQTIRFYVFQFCACATHFAVEPGQICSCKLPKLPNASVVLFLCLKSTRSSRRCCWEGEILCNLCDQQQTN